MAYIGHGDNDGSLPIWMQLQQGNSILSEVGRVIFIANLVGVSTGGKDRPYLGPCDGLSTEKRKHPEIKLLGQAFLVRSAQAAVDSNVHRPHSDPTYERTSITGHTECICSISMMKTRSK